MKLGNFYEIINPETLVSICRNTHSETGEVSKQEIYHGSWYGLHKASRMEKNTAATEFLNKAEIIDIKAIDREGEPHLQIYLD